MNLYYSISIHFLILFSPLSLIIILFLLRSLKQCIICCQSLSPEKKTSKKGDNEYYTPPREIFESFGNFFGATELNVLSGFAIDNQAESEYSEEPISFISTGDGFKKDATKNELYAFFLVNCCAAFGLITAFIFIQVLAFIQISKSIQSFTSISDSLLFWVLFWVAVSGICIGHLLAVGAYLFTLLFCHLYIELLCLQKIPSNRFGNAPSNFLNSITNYNADQLQMNYATPYSPLLQLEPLEEDEEGERSKKLGAFIHGVKLERILSFNDNEHSNNSESEESEESETGFLSDYLLKSNAQFYEYESDKSDE
jgi:hypothetical protein